MKITNVPMTNRLQNASTSPDPLLIQRFQTGQSSVFDQFYHRHHDRIFGVICTMISNYEDAIDLTQELSTTVSITYAGSSLSDEPYTAHKGIYDHPYHAALETEEFLRQVHDALSALTPKQHTVFHLHYKHQLPLKDIADRLERSVDTAKAHLFHARRKLRHELLPYFECTL